MGEENRRQNFWKALGPGLLWAGAAVGVSHLVQSTRAGASFGLGLIGIVIFALIFKYPAFSFGPRYAAATGTSLLEGYRRRGIWALVLYAILTLGTMFTIQAAVTVVTAALGIVLIGWNDPSGLVILSTTITLTCALLLVIGQYKWLDKIIKAVVVVLTLSTLAATALVLPRVDFSSAQLVPSTVLFTDFSVIMFMVALVGWMPSAFDISIWHSLWTLARRRETGYAATVKEALLDFNIGYLGTGVMALCFVALGAGVMFNSGKVFPASAGGFANQVITLYTENLGTWSKPLITVSAFTVMFSTTLTVIDGFPRAISTLLSRFRDSEVAGQPLDINHKRYWASLAVLAMGSLGIIAFLLKSLISLVDLATILSFLTAPVLAWLNHRAILGKEVPEEHQPGRCMIFYSWAGIGFSSLFAVYFLWVRLIG